jgi:hypothetical protein
LSIRIPDESPMNTPQVDPDERREMDKGAAPPE